jgi:hypothetical protein
MDEVDTSDRQRLLIEMVMRQTGYTYEKANEKLELCDNNYITVIRESMGIKKEEDNTVKSINQAVYKEMRGLMDTAAATYRRKQEMEKKKEEIIEKMKEEYNRRQVIKKEELSSTEEVNEENLGSSVIED